MMTLKTKSVFGLVAGLAIALSLVIGAGTASALTAGDIDTLVALGIISADKAAAAKAALVTTSYSNLKIGSTGADVVALQEMLVKGGYLVMPAGVKYGYYGSLTAAAYAKYQAAQVTTTTTTTTTTSSDLEGGAGDITVTEISTDVEDTVLEGETENVLGFKVEASDSDVALTNLKVSLVNGDADGSYRLSRYAEEVSVYLGSKKVGSADVSDFTKSGTTYSKSIALDEAIVREGSSKKGTFYVKVSALSNIDSTDVDNNSWTLTVENIRYTDATGAILTDTTSPESTFAFSDLASSGDVTLTVSKGTANPSADSVTVSDSGSTSDVLMLEFKMKAKGSELSFDSVDVAIATTSGTVGTISDILGELTLKNGSDELASVSSFDNDGADTVTFDLDDTFTIGQDDTEVFRVYAKINDVDNYTSGDGLTVDFDDVVAEDDNGDVVTETGSANGEEQTFVIDVPTVSLVGTPTLAVYTHTDGAASGEEDLYKATITFNVTAPDSNDVYLPLDTFAYGTAGTQGVEFTVSGGATTTSAALAYVGSTSNVEQDNSVLVSAGDTEKFTLTVYLSGNDAQGKVTVTSVWYEVSDTTPNGTPEITTGLTNFKTPLVLLAK